MTACPLCGERLSPGPTEWVRRCPTCDHEVSGLEPRIGLSGALNQERVSEGLQDLRRQTHAHLLDLLGTSLGRMQGRLLDVGCSTGLFLEAARNRGFEVQGLEPDPAVASVARARGLPVISGFFPADVPPDTFDLITFNDVLEHLPDPAEALSACRRHLAPDGLLAVTVPVREGVLFKTARVLHRLGLSRPYERLWQKDFPSPHLHYFDGRGLRGLASRHGLDLVLQAPIRSVKLSGLWARLRADRDTALPAAALLWLGIAASIPALRLLPSDIRLMVFRPGTVPERA